VIAEDEYFEAIGHGRRQLRLLLPADLGDLREPAFWVLAALGYLGPMNNQELCRATGYSSGTVSTAVKLLAQVGAATTAEGRDNREHRAMATAAGRARLRQAWAAYRAEAARAAPFHA
jgi:DNA-binding MarR family transcriptional regulator